MKTNAENTAKWVDLLFGASVALMGVTSLILSVTGLAGIALPVWAVRLVGILNLASLPVLAYSMVKSFQEKLSMRKAAGSKSSRTGVKKKKKGKKK